MSNTISNKTVCRGLTGIALQKTCASFAKIGADYRAAQTTPIQKFINWLAQLLDSNYAVRTLSEVSYKEQALRRDFMAMAEEILKAKVAEDGSVSIRFKIDDEDMEIVSNPVSPHTPGKLYVRHLWNDQELSVIDLQGLKLILLKEYMRLTRPTLDAGTQMDLSRFDLTGMDLTEMNFENCLMPDLVECRLLNIQFDITTTTFGKRTMCRIDDNTVDRLQGYGYQNNDGVVPENLSIDLTQIPENPQVMNPSISRMSMSTVFSSKNPDFALKKAGLLRYKKAEANNCFQQMREDNMEINLTELDLRNFDLRGMNLRGANFSGTKLEYTDFAHSNLSYCSFQNAVLFHTYLYGADFAYTNMLHAAKELVIVVRSVDFSKALGYLNHGYSRRFYVESYEDRPGFPIISRRYRCE